MDIPISEVVKLCEMLRLRETERWEEIGRPKNDGYINGSHSGYGHALRDVEQWLGHIKKAMELKQIAPIRSDPDASKDKSAITRRFSTMDLCILDSNGNLIEVNEHDLETRR